MWKSFVSHWNCKTLKHLFPGIFSLHPLLRLLWSILVSQHIFNNGNKYLIDVYRKFLTLDDSLGEKKFSWWQTIERMETAAEFSALSLKLSSENFFCNNWIDNLMINISKCLRRLLLLLTTLKTWKISHWGCPDDYTFKWLIFDKLKVILKVVISNTHFLSIDCHLGFQWGLLKKHCNTSGNQ